MAKLAAGEEALPGYRLIEEIGRGGCGIVWKATRRIGGYVALKFVPLDTAAARIESQALDFFKTISHPNLVSLFDAWLLDGHLVIGMELAQGTLWDRLETARTDGLPGIPFALLVEYFEQAARGLDYLNAQHHQHPQGGAGLVSYQHRDIKPQNLLLVGDGVKVGDWGLLRMLEGVITGHTGSKTEAYAAPEFFQGKTTHRSDQYSLAVTYVVLRTGQLPFRGDQREGHLHREPDLGPIIDRRERQAILRALAKNPQNRWSNCREFVDTLRTTASAGPVAFNFTGEGISVADVRTDRVGMTGGAVLVPRFHAGGVVPPRSFINRERDLAEAQEMIEDGQSFLIVGKHRVGKTSFCKQLIHRLMGTPNNQVLAAYLNLQGCVNLTAETFLEHTIVNLLGEIARQVFHCKYSDLMRANPADANPLLASDPVFESFVHIFRLVTERTHARNNVTPAPLGLQEFMEFARDLLELIRLRGWDHFAIFHDEANRLPRDLSIDLLVSNEEYLNTAGATCVYVASPEMAERFRPLFEACGRELHLGPFPNINDLRRLLACYCFNDPKRTEEVPVTSEGLELLWNRTGGQPYLIQLVARRSFELARAGDAGRVEVEHVADAFDALRTEGRLPPAEEYGGK